MRKTEDFKEIIKEIVESEKEIDLHSNVSHTNS
jgi:hypothetical protein